MFGKPVTKAALAAQIAALAKQISDLRTELLERFDSTDKGEQKEMAAIDDLTALEQTEHADLVTLSGLVTQVLSAVANGQMTQQQAQTLLTAMQGDDATVKSNIASIQAALPTPPAAPVAGQ